MSTDSTIVYFPGEANELIAVRAATGEIEWRSPTRIGGGFTVGFGTAISGPVVVMVDLFLYGFDRTTGQRLWVFQGEGTANPANSNPAANDSLVFTGSGDGLAWALRATTGEIVWRRPSPVPYKALVLHPRVSGDLVFFGYSEEGAGERGALAALDAATGEVRWLHDFVPYVEPGQDAGCYGNVVFDANTVYAWIGRGDVIALDRETGEVVWHRPQENPLLGTVRRPLALGGDVLVAGSTRGTLTGYRAATGEELWSRDLMAGSLNEPLVHDETKVFATFTGGPVAAFDAETGATLWSQGMRGRGATFGLFGPGAVDEHHVYFAGTEGLFALRK